MVMCYFSGGVEHMNMVKAIDDWDVMEEEDKTKEEEEEELSYENNGMENKRDKNAATGDDIEGEEGEQNDYDNNNNKEEEEEEEVEFEDTDKEGDDNGYNKL